MFRKMPIILMAMIVLMGVSHQWLPLSFKSALYGISLSLKSLIVFVLPFLIFGLLFKTSVQLAKKASKWILFILIAICLSNFVSTMISYLIGTIAYQFDLSMTLPSDKSSLIPLWNFSLPKLIGNSYAMFAGLILGILCGWLKPSLGEKLGLYFEKYISAFLKVFLYMIPLFIGGFIIKMLHDGMMGQILQNYALIFALVAGAVFAYIGLIYFALSGKAFVKSLKNMLPAAIAGFGSMSSAAAMPLTMIGTEKNSKNRDIAR